MTSDQPVVHGGLGQLCELSCLVYADPEAEVVWYRDTMRLDPSERRWDRIKILLKDFRRQLKVAQLKKLFDAITFLWQQGLIFLT